MSNLTDSFEKVIFATDAVGFSKLVSKNASYFLGKQLDAFEKMQKAKSLNPDLLKYAELMQKLQRNKEFGQSYLEAVNAIFNSKH